MKLKSNIAGSGYWIVGGGASLKGFDWNALNGEKSVLAINDAYKVLPNASIVYFTDPDWYNKNEQGLQRFNGMKWCGSLKKDNFAGKHTYKIWEDVPWHGNFDNLCQFLLTGETGLETRKGMLKHGRNSAYAALNALVNIIKDFSNKRIYLLGIDMIQGHWHNDYIRETPNNVYEKMIENFDNVAPIIKDLGIEVINVTKSDDSTKLRCFPIKTFSEIFDK